MLAKEICSRAGNRRIRHHGYRVARMKDSMGRGVRQGPGVVVPLLAVTVILGCWAPLEAAGPGTACFSNGGATGMNLTSRGVIDRTDIQSRPYGYILKDTGSINCYGVVTEWKFYKEGSIPCHNMDFYVWRLQPGFSDWYQMIGKNSYTGQDCLDPDDKIITFKIPANEQIPVEPDDLIGWTSYTRDIMVSGDPGGPQIVCQNVGATLGGSCRFNRPTLNYDMSLQAIVTRGPPALFSTLPREQTIDPGSYPVTSVYFATAVHPGNEVPQDYDTVMDDAVVLTYDFGPGVADFTIRSTNGEIRTVNNLEYEAGRVYELPVTVTALALTSTATLTVTVRDTPPILDIKPPASPVTVTVSALDKLEDDEVYSVCLDTEYTGEGTVNYYMSRMATAAQNQAPPFYIQEDTGMVRCSMDLSSFLPDDPPDLVYQFTVTATDGVLSDTETLVITLTHVRTAPAMRNLPYTVSVPEDVPDDQRLYQVKADTTYPEPLTFWIESVVPATHLDAFAIDPTSGDVWVTQNHGLVRNTNYLISIGTNDTKLATTGTLTVAVTTVNQAPYFDPKEYFVRVPEKCGDDTTGTCPTYPPGWQVPNLSMKYEDREGGPFTCQPTPYPAFASDRFSFSDGAGDCVLFVTNTIDVDTDPSLQSINLTTSVSDGSLEGVGYVYLTFYDINDQIPQFTTSNYTGTIDENTRGGVSLLTITATDPDLTSPNNKVSYYIQSKDGSGLANLYFQINADTGVLSTKQPVDYETYTYIEFEVVAQDGGNPQKSSTADVLIIINDLNDLHPEFQCVGRAEDDPYPLWQDCFYNLELRSDTYIGHEVFQLLSTDNDTVTPKTFYFLLKPDEHFLLQNHDGLILTKQELDHYTKYILYCYSEDRGTPNLLTQVQYMRIDTYEAKWHLVDVTLEMSITEFNQTSEQLGFLTALRDLLQPWHVKMENFILFKGKTKVTIYALTDNTTYYISNLRQEKNFVHRNDLLSKLRKNIHGTPNDDLQGPDFDEFQPIKVMPTYPIWWIDTVEGIATICLLCFLFLFACIAIATLICKRQGILCFKKKSPADHKWTDNKAPVKVNYTDHDQMKLNYAVSATSDSVRHRNHTSLPKDQETEEDEGGRSHRSDSVTSVDTIHTVIYDKRKPDYN